MCRRILIHIYPLLESWRRQNQVEILAFTRNFSFLIFTSSEHLFANFVATNIFNVYTSIGETQTGVRGIVCTDAPWNDPVGTYKWMVSDLETGR